MDKTLLKVVSPVSVLLLWNQIYKLTKTLFYSGKHQKQTVLVCFAVLSKYFPSLPEFLSENEEKLQTAGLHVGKLRIRLVCLV